MDTATVVTGDSVNGKIVVAIPTADAESGHWRVSYKTAEYYFAAE